MIRVIRFIRVTMDSRIVIPGIRKLGLLESNMVSRFSRAIEAIRVTRVPRIVIPEIRRLDY